MPEITGGVVQGAFCYDLMYSSDKTVFIKWAIENGALRAVDGLGMLVEQAAESFFIWHGVKPNTAKVIYSWDTKKSLVLQNVQSFIT